MKRTAILTLAILMLTLPVGAALTDLPTGSLSQWTGKSTFYVNLGNGKYADGTIEFAVYDAQAIGDLGLTVPGNKQYLYAYQIFNTGEYGGNAALSYFGLTGIGEGVIEGEDNLGTSAVANGLDATDKGVNLSKTKAFFKFGSGDGILLKGSKSYFLLIGSDAAPKVGGYEFRPAADEELPVPDGEPNTPPVPEPATLALLIGGSVLALRKRQA